MKFLDRVSSVNEFNKNSIQTQHILKIFYL